MRYFYWYYYAEVGKSRKYVNPFIFTCVFSFRGLMVYVPDLYSRLTKIAIRLEEVESSIVQLEMEKEELKREQRELREKINKATTKTHFTQTDLNNWRANQQSTVDLLREEIGSDVFDV